jgi:hypothetical protein
MVSVSLLNLMSLLYIYSEFAFAMTAILPVLVQYAANSSRMGRSAKVRCCVREQSQDRRDSELTWNAAAVCSSLEVNIESIDGVI